MTLEHLEALIAFAVVMLGVSLLITILTQMVSALFGLRGTNLLWGVRTLLGAIDERIESQAEEVLRRPLISDSVCTKCLSKFKDTPVIGRLVKRWTLASAIRPGELAHALHVLSAELKAKGDAPPAAPPGDAKAVSAEAEAKANAKATSEAIDKALKELDPELERQIALLKAAAEKVAGASVQQAEQRVQQLVEAVQKSVGKLEVLFNTAMDRMSARFALQMRLCTVLFAGVIAIGVQLDSFKLLEQLWSDPEMRASLVNSRDAMLKEAGVVISPAGGSDNTSVSADPGAFSAAIATLKTSKPAATEHITDIPALFANLSEAVKWLEPKLIGDENAKKALVAEYTRLVSVELKNHATSIQTLLNNSQFQLIPTPFPKFPPEGKRHIAGILITWALLSLGAPFWFNALKSLSSLRPILASAQPPKDQGTTS
jgi:hypothetical protein